MKALTLWRPWDTAILYLGKPVENRVWPPPAALIGQRFALHSGKKWDDEGGAFIYQTALAQGCTKAEMQIHLDRAANLDSAIIGTVRLASVIQENRSNDPIHDGPWFFGPYGWVVDQLAPFKTPVPCRGAQGLWTIPADVLPVVLERERLALAGAEVPHG